MQVGRREMLDQTTDTPDDSTSCAVANFYTCAAYKCSLFMQVINSLILNETLDCDRSKFRHASWYIVLRLENRKEEKKERKMHIRSYCLHSL